MKSESSDDDMPPPLEDMTERLQSSKTKKEAATGTFGGADKTADHVEEIRLAPKKPSPAGAKMEGPKQGLAPKDADYDFDAKGNDKAPKSQAVNSQKAAEPTKQAPAQKKQKKNDGFGGFAAGFLSGPPQKKKKPAAQVKKAEPKVVEVEDQTHLKAQSKGDKLKLDEVQDAMNTNHAQAKKDWLTPEFFEKLAKNPKLLKAFQNPQYMQAFTEFGQDPKEAMKKYGSDPDFRELMMEFSGFMGDHFGTVADTKAAEAEQQRKEQEEQLKSDPVFQTIQSDPQVQEYLKDPEVQEILNHLRFQGGLDLHQVLRDKPAVGQKMMFLINKGVLNTQSHL